MIQRILEEENARFFSPRSIHVDFLKNHPELIPTLAQWLYDEWHIYDHSLTKEVLIHSFNMRLHTDTLPIAFVALKDSRLNWCDFFKRRNRS